MEIVLEWASKYFSQPSFRYYQRYLHFGMSTNDEQLVGQQENYICQNIYPLLINKIKKIKIKIKNKQIK